MKRVKDMGDPIEELRRARETQAQIELKSREGLIEWVREMEDEIERLNDECNDLAHQLNRSNERSGQMHSLLVWAESMICSLSGWPEHHPDEVLIWREDWRKVRDRNEESEYKSTNAAHQELAAHVRKSDAELIELRAEIEQLNKLLKQEVEHFALVQQAANDCGARSSGCVLSAAQSHRCTDGMSMGSVVLVASMQQI